MDEKQREMAIWLAEKKIEELQQFVTSLKNLSSEKPKGQKRGRKRKLEPTELALHIHFFLSEFGGVLTPKEIYTPVGAMTEEARSQVRVTLRKFKGHLFENPEYGKWKPIEQKRGSREREKLPVGGLASLEVET